MDIHYTQTLIHTYTCIYVYTHAYTQKYMHLWGKAKKGPHNYIMLLLRVHLGIVYLSIYMYIVCIYIVYLFLEVYWGS